METIITSKNARNVWKSINKKYRDDKKSKHPFFYYANRIAFHASIWSLVVCIILEAYAAVSEIKGIKSSNEIWLLRMFCVATLFALIMWMTDVFPRGDKYQRWQEAFGCLDDDKEFFKKYISLQTNLKPSTEAKLLTWLFRTLYMIPVAIFIPSTMDIVKNSTLNNIIWKLMQIFFFLFFSWYVKKIIDTIARHFSQDLDYENMRKIVEYKLFDNIMKKL